ncbi:hypothetical protein JQC92_02640 [Shewanella sp. 202IG2-18]|uniref:hypothetical protein n=1 Tax=Parashewanella hymeniacidonis TaxID=2807618 RepID=UPI00195FF9B5|nr:hypothetical protein [Parashewanella hymeniacidonis]MBM7070940.1 hypothetical protein [Parashewanella hymeniacidonis]
MIRKLAILTLLAIAAHQGWQKLAPKPELEPIFDSAYVAVYGRNTCGHTQRLVKQLKAQGYTPHYFSVDDKAVADELHERMESQGMSVERYDLPVVDVNANLRIRPSLENVQQIYRTTK